MYKVGSLLLFILQPIVLNEVVVNTQEQNSEYLTGSLCLLDRLTIFLLLLNNDNIVFGFSGEALGTRRKTELYIGNKTHNILCAVNKMLYYSDVETFLWWVMSLL